jgi:hypothetical protein
MRLKTFRNKRGAILDAFDDHSGEHLGTIMVVELPPVLAALPEWCKDSTPVVIVKQAIPIRRGITRQPRGSVGLWSDVRVEYPE